MDECKTFAIEIQRETGIPVFSSGIERILCALCTSANVWSVIRDSKQPANTVNATIRLLIKNGYTDKKTLAFTDKGKKLIERLHIHSVISPRCADCGGRGIDVFYDHGLYDTFFKIQKNRPQPKQEYSQGYITPNSTIARVLLALERGDIENKDIVVLGAEDDLIGLALALTKKPRRVLVLDIDKRIIDFDNTVAKKLNLPLEARVFDLRKPLPSTWIGAFDTFFTEPPETEQSIRGFILKGVSSLRGPGSAGYFGFTLVDSSLTKWWKLQKILNVHGLVLTDLLQDFNHYVNFEWLKHTKVYKERAAGSLPFDTWFLSHWHRVVTMADFKRVNLDLTHVGAELYKDKETATEE